MALNLNGTTQYASAPVSIGAAGNKFTLVAFIKANSSSSDASLVALNRTTSFQRSNGLSIRGSQAGPPLAHYYFSGSDIYSNSGNVSDGNWLCVILEKTTTGNTTSGQVYVTYNNTTTGITSSIVNGALVDPAVLNELIIGAVKESGSATKNFSGKVSHVAFWDNINLTSQDRIDLINRVKTPDQLSTSPTYYRELVSNSTAGIGATTLTLVGSPSFDSDSPYIITPTLSSISSDNSIVAGAVNDTYVGTNLGTDATNILVTASDGTTQQWSITGATATGGTISLAALGNLPYPINGNTLSAKIRNGTTDIATLASPLVITAPSGYVALPVVDANTNKTDNESAFAGYGTVPVGSMAEMSTTDNLGNIVSFEMFSGNWTGRVYYQNYVAVGGEEISGRFRSGSSKAWENLSLTVALPESEDSIGTYQTIFSDSISNTFENAFSNTIH